MSRLKDVVTQLRQFAGLLADSSAAALPEDLAPEVAFSFEGLGALTLSGTHAHTYQTFVRQIADFVGDRATEAAVTSLVQRMVLKTIDAVKQRPEVPLLQRASEAADDLLAALTAPLHEFVSYFPVAGLRPPDTPWGIGDVTLFRPTGDAINEVFGGPEQIISRSKHTPEEQAALKQIVLTQALTAYGDFSLAAVRTRAIEAGAAHAAAKRLLRFVLDCLGFYADLLENPGLCCRFTEWPVRPVHRWVLVMDDTSKEQFTTHAEMLGPLHILPAAAYRTQAAESLGVPRLVQILSSVSRNGAEERLASAIQWAGRAVAEVRPEEAFLLLAIALESIILGPKQDAELQMRLSYRVAHLLGADLGTRERIVKDIRRLYNLRSKIVHSGVYEVPPDDLQLMRAYTKRVFVRLLTHEPFSSMKAGDDLDKWFDHAVLGA